MAEPVTPFAEAPQRVRLSQVLRDFDGLSYGIVQPGKHIASGVPIIRVTDLQSDAIDVRSPLRVDPGIAEQHKRTRLVGGEVLLSVVGTVGRVAVVPPELAGWNVARAIAVLRPNDPSLTRWLWYALQTPEVRRAMGVAKTDTVQATLNLRDVALLEVPFPETEIRRRITHVLKSLDDLIDVNDRIVRAVGECWRAQTSSHATSDTGEQLSDIASFTNGRNFTKAASGSGRPVIRTPEVREGPRGSTVRSDVDAAEQHLADPGDILFVWSGTLMVNRWRHEQGLVNQHVFKVTPATGVPDWLVLFAIESLMPWFRRVASDKATTMGHIQRAHLDAPVLLPDRSSWPVLNAKLKPLYDLELSLAMENESLRQARDELLPLLMSGRIRALEVAS